jgi:hypothetical protein
MGWQGRLLSRMFASKSKGIWGWGRRGAECCPHHRQYEFVRRARLCRRSCSTAVSLVLFVLTKRKAVWRKDLASLYSLHQLKLRIASAILANPWFSFIRKMEHTHTHKRRGSLKNIQFHCHTKGPSYNLQLKFIGISWMAQYDDKHCNFVFKGCKFDSRPGLRVLSFSWSLSEHSEEHEFSVLHIFIEYPFMVVSNFSSHSEENLFYFQLGALRGLPSRFCRVLTMVYNTQDYWAFGLCPSSGILNNTMFPKVDLFLSSGVGMRGTYSLGSLTGPAIADQSRMRWSSLLHVSSYCSAQLSTYTKLQFYLTDTISQCFLSVGWCSGYVLCRYFGGVRFESRPRHRLSWLKYFLVFLNPFRKIPEQYHYSDATVSFQIFSNSSFIIAPSDALKLTWIPLQNNRLPVSLQHATTLRERNNNSQCWTGM